MVRVVWSEPRECSKEISTLPSLAERYAVSLAKMRSRTDPCWLLSSGFHFVVCLGLRQWKLLVSSQSVSEDTQLSGVRSGMDQRGECVLKSLIRRVGI